MSDKDTAQGYVGNDRLLLGIVLAVVTFWLFAQTALNVAPDMRADLGITENWSNIAVSIAALFSGIFTVVFGGLGDKFGRVKVTQIGVVLNIIGSLLIALSPSGTVVFLMAGRIIQGLSAACIMPSTLALLKSYYDGASRQRAVSYWSIGSWEARDSAPSSAALSLPVSAGVIYSLPPLLFPSSVCTSSKEHRKAK